LNFFLIVALVAIINTTNIRFGLFFFGQPLVLGGILGLILNDMGVGLYVGSIIQLMWVRSMPIGVKVQTNYTLITFLTIFFIKIFDTPFYPLIFILSYVFATVAKYLEKIIKKINSHIVDLVMKNLKKVNLDILHIIYLIVYTIIFFLFFLISFYVMHFFLLKLVFYVPEKMLLAFQASYKYLILYALSLMYQSVSFKFKFFYFLGGAGLALFLILAQLPFYMALIVLVLMTIFVSLLEQKKWIFGGNN